MTAPEQFDWKSWIEAQRRSWRDDWEADVPALCRALEMVAEMVERTTAHVESDGFSQGYWHTETPTERDARISAVVLKAIGGGK